MMAATKKPSGDKGLLSIAREAPKPTPAAKGRLLNIPLLREIIPPRSNGQPRTNWWFNHSFLPSKRVKVGRDNCWWELDVYDALGTGRLTK